MDGLESGMRSATEELERIERDRETAIARSRMVIRLSKRAIHAIHTGGSPDVVMDEMEAAMDGLRSTDAPEVMLSPVVQDAMAEYAEAAILRSVVMEGRVPPASELGIPASPWLMGLADCVGELRRTVATCLMEGDLEGARRHHGAMEEIGDQLMMLDIPDAVLPFRRKQDIARGILDRTRSDMTTAALMLPDRDMVD